MSGWLWVFCRVGVILDWDGSGAEIRAAYASGRCTPVRC